MPIASGECASRKCGTTFLLLFLMLGVACSPQQIVTPTATQEPSPTSTHTPRPSTTPKPTTSPTPEAPTFVSAPEQPPHWLGDPVINVLAVAVGDVALCRDAGAFQLQFMNAETGERFDLDISPVRAMMWLGSTRFGLLTMDGQVVISIDLVDGTTEMSSLDAEGIRLVQGTELIGTGDLDCPMTPLELVEGSSVGEGSLAFISPRRSYSADLSLFAELGTDEYDDLDPFDALEVRRVGSGELIWSADPEDEYDDTFEREFAWSPTEPGKLAVVECGIGALDRCVLQRLYVVDVLSGEQLGSYPGGFKNIIWSPDGQQLLYTSPEWELPRVDQRYPVEYSGPPCVLDLTARSSRCFHEIGAAHFPDEFIFLDQQVLDLRWSRRGDGFFYTYRGYYYEPGDQGGTGDHFALSGLCRMDLATRQIDCPSEDLPELEASWLGYSELSPQEQFAYLQASSEGVVHGVLDSGRHQFYPLPVPSGVTYLDALLDSIRILWRPPTPIDRPVAVRSSRPTDRDIEQASSIWALSGLPQSLDLAEPGLRRFSMALDGDQPVIWPYFWCAANSQTLAGNLKWITADFLIDDVRVRAEDILQYETEGGGWTCHYWATMLTGWQSGAAVSLAVQLAFARDIHDGYERYPAGDYRYELRVRVDE